MKIALIYDCNLMSASAASACPHDPWITSDTTVALSAAQSSLATEHEVLLIANDAQMEDRLLAFWPDMVINLVEEGKDSAHDIAITALLEHWHVPFTGSSLHTQQVCRDRSASRRVLRKNGLPIPVFMVVQAPEEIRGVERFPLSVKPLYEGEALSLESEAVVHSGSELLTRVCWVLDTYDQPALVATSLTGREFLVAVLGNGSAAQVLPLVEPDMPASPAESLAVVAGDNPGERTLVERRETLYRCPAEVSPALAQGLTELARQAFIALECQDFCGVLMRLDADGQPYILDINPHPGLLPHPDTPSAFLTAVAATPMTYPDLIRHIWRLACTRYGLMV
jgi:D-alanine-D-alanine ligase